jgi:uncharacterized protein YwqG
VSALQAEALAEMRDRAIPYLQLVLSASGRSSIGGRPRLGNSLTWPSRSGRPLSFLAQIDLEEVKAAGGPDWLPGRGVLFFFYDADDGPWGFSPDDKDGWAVLFDAAPKQTATGQCPPEPPPIEFPAQLLGFQSRRSLPSPQRLDTDISTLDEAGWEALDAAFEADAEDPPWHRLGGWPRPIQNDDMELECQLASSGIDCGTPGAYGSSAADRLRPGAKEWRLLLQLDSDDDSEMMWGDSGILYFWIREVDARAGDFSRVWMILQCC